MKTPVRTRLLSALLSLVMLVSLLPVSVFAAEPASGTWEKVTEAQEDWSGQYLIVYEKGSLIMDGSLSALDKEGNKVDVTITDGKIVGDYAKYAFTIAPMTGGWSVQSASGKYISGKSGSNKIITGSTPELNTITFADGNVKIASNNTTLQYNAAATNGTRFRYYKSENQQPVALYKLSTVPARESGIVTDLTTLQNGDKVVVFNPANKKALSSVYNGFYNTGVDVELTGGKLTGYTDAELWTVNRTESGAYTFSTADGKKLSMDEKYSSTPLDKANVDWELSAAATADCFYIKNVGRGSYLEWFAEKNNWSSYGTIGSNEALFAQQLYLVAESPEPGQPEDPTAPLKNGDQVVIYNPANLKALSSEYTGFYNKGTDVTLTGGKLAGGKQSFIAADGWPPPPTARSCPWTKNTPALPWTRPTPAGHWSRLPPRAVTTLRTWAATAIWSGMPRRTTGVPSAPSAAMKLCLPRHSSKSRKAASLPPYPTATRWWYSTPPTARPCPRSTPASITRAPT